VPGRDAHHQRTPPSPLPHLSSSRSIYSLETNRAPNAVPAMLNRATPPERANRLSLDPKAFCLTLGEATASLGVRTSSELPSDMFLPTKTSQSLATGLLLPDIFALRFWSEGLGRVPSTYATNSFNVISFSISFSFRLSSDICWARATASSTLVVIPGKGCPKTNFGDPYYRTLAS